MKKKMLQSTLVALVLGLVLCTLLSAFVFETRESEHTQEDLQRLVSTMAQRFDATASPKQEAKTLSHAAGGLRVTIVGADGAVLGDSAAEETKMENHAQRGEIADAATSMYGVSVRRSVTTGSNTMYVATRLPDGSLLRVAATYPGMLRGLAQFLPAMLTAALIALMVGGAFADRMSKSISAPIVELSESLKRVVAGETKLEPNAYKYEELQDMAVDINSLSDEVDAALKHLESERDRIGYVLDNMGEGLVLLDGNEEILLLNNAAAALLCCPRELAGKNIIYATRNTDLLMTIDRAVKQQTDGESILRLSSGQTIEARAHAIASGALLVLQDVSAQHSAVRMRQEFFASASHELKTPITSIKGFAELLCSEEIAPAQQREFAARILKETTTMQNLIGDIIM
ncbi:MAG: histidine kinase dimerization/phospho-acceptor domain-containing protein, partial [Ruthenibacterium sp.]